MRLLSPEHRLAAIAGAVSVVYWPFIFAAPTMPRWWLIAVLTPLLCTLDPRRVDPLVGLLFCAGVGSAVAVSVNGGHWVEGVLPIYFLAALSAVAMAAASVEDVSPAILAAAAGISVQGVICALQFLDIAIPLVPLPAP